MTLQPPGGFDPTFGGLVLALLAFNVCWYLTVRLLQRSDAAGALSGRETDQGRETVSGTVRCPECETENERDYRYCRSCVGTLPTAATAGQHGGLSSGRLVR
jgi:hypothetical protein